MILVSQILVICITEQRNPIEVGQRSDIESTRSVRHINGGSGLGMRMQKVPDIVISGNLWTAYCGEWTMVAAAIVHQREGLAEVCNGEVDRT